MKMKLLALALGLSTGCYSVEIAQSPVLGPASAGHITVSNYGWTLFGCVPVVCGNAHDESGCPFAFFRNDLKPEQARAKLEAEAKARSAVATDVWYLGTNGVLFDAYYSPVPWIVVYKEVNLSANLVKKGGAE